MHGNIYKSLTARVRYLSGDQAFGLKPDVLSKCIFKIAGLI
jgi:hypothetical protein